MCTNFSVNTCTIYAKNHGLLAILVTETMCKPYQMKMPRLWEAHRGSLALQSAQISSHRLRLVCSCSWRDLLFPGCNASSETIFWFRCLFWDICSQAIRNTWRYVEATDWLNSVAVTRMWTLWTVTDKDYYQPDLVILFLYTIFLNTSTQSQYINTLLCLNKYRVKSKKL